MPGRFMQRSRLLFGAVGVVLMLAGCSVSSSGSAGTESNLGGLTNPLASLPQPLGKVAVKLDFVSPKSEHSPLRPRLAQDASQFTLTVFDTPSELADAQAGVTRQAGANTQEVVVDVPIGPKRVLVQGRTSDGSSLGTFEQEITVSEGATANVLVTSLFSPGPTRELGLLAVTSNGVQANGVSHSPSVSGSGDQVAFCTNATNLVSGDTNGKSDILIRSRTSNALSRVSLADNGSQFTFDCLDPDMSDNGRFVSFLVASNSPRNIAGVEIPTGQVVVRDRGGRTFAFSSTAFGFSSKTVTTIPPSTTTFSSGSLLGKRILLGSEPCLSGDGKFVAWVALPIEGGSGAALFTPDGTSQIAIAPVDDPASKEAVSRTVGNSLANGTCSSPSLSQDGRFVAFISDAPGLDRDTGLPPAAVYLRDRVQGVTTRVAQAPDGPYATRCALSGNGRFVAVLTSRRLFLVDRQTGQQTDVIGQANTIAIAMTLSGNPSISNDGRYLSFYGRGNSPAYADPSNKTNAFVWDRLTGEFCRLNLASDGTAVEGGVPDGRRLEGPDLSADGTRMAFASADSLLVPGDNNGLQDVFSANVPTPGTLYSVSGNAVQRFQGITSLRTGTIAPVAAIEGPNTRLTAPHRLYLDTSNDRLYVTNGAPGGQQSILVFNQASTLTGDVAPDRRMVVGTGNQIADLVLDTNRDLLYLVNSDKKVFVYSNLSTLDGQIIPSRIISSFANNLYEALFLDSRRNELYCGANQRVDVFSSASGADGTVTPARSILDNQLMGQASGISLSSTPIGLVFGANNSNLLVLSSLAGLNTNSSLTEYNGNGSDAQAVTSILGQPIPDGARSQLFLDHNTGTAYILDRGAIPGIPSPATLVSKRVGRSTVNPFQTNRAITLGGARDGFVIDRTR